MPISGVVLDHVAVATERWSNAWPLFVEKLGGRWGSGGHAIGFSPAQLCFANEARLEVLSPNAVEQNDFLRRFLDANGPGPHHLTFKVPDIEAALAAVSDAGLTPVSVDLSDPDWREMFIHPRQAGGVVVQLAWASGPLVSPVPEEFPTPAPVPAALTHVTHVAADLDKALELFCGLLGGVADDLDGGADRTWRGVEVRWPGPLAVRLITPTSTSSPLNTWMGGRPGRVHHLRFVADGPVQVIEPEGELGVRVVVGPAGQPSGVAGDNQ